MGQHATDLGIFELHCSKQIEYRRSLVDQVQQCMAAHQVVDLHNRAV
jgi:hypothetical protein